MYVQSMSLLNDHSPTFRLQTELEANTHETEAGAQRDAANTHTFGSGVHRSPPNANVVPDVRKDVSDTPAIISGIHRNTSKSHEHAVGQNPGVSTFCIILVTEQLLTVAQAHARSVIWIATGFSI